MSEAHLPVEPVEKENDAAGENRPKNKRSLIAVSSVSAGLVCDWRTGECAMPDDQAENRSQGGAQEGH